MLPNDEHMHTTAENLASPHKHHINNPALNNAAVLAAESLRQHNVRLVTMLSSPELCMFQHCSALQWSYQSSRCMQRGPSHNARHTSARSCSLLQHTCACCCKELQDYLTAGCCSVGSQDQPRLVDAIQGKALEGSLLIHALSKLVAQQDDLLELPAVSSSQGRDIEHNKYHVMHRHKTM